jgi:CspA family cold shock protein
MAIGTVKWFNNAKGYGFVRPINDEGEDIFAHFSTIIMDGYKTLKAGQLVEFEISTGPKGLHAINIRPSVSEEAVRENAGELAARSITAPITAAPATARAVAEGEKVE